MPDPAPITAAEFAKKLVEKLEGLALTNRKQIAHRPGHFYYQHRAECFEDAIEYVRDLAAKHGVKLEGGE